MDEYVGIAASALTTACWVPQVLRSLRRGTVSDFAWSYLVLYAAGLAFWVLYGVLRRDVVISTSNALVLAGVILLAAVKVRSRHFHFDHFDLVVPHGVDPAAALESLQELGPRLAADLRTVGIADPASLRATGVDEANRRLVEAGLQTGVHSRQAIERALGNSGTVESTWGVAKLRPHRRPGR